MARSTDPDVVLLDAGRFEPELAASMRVLGGQAAVLLLTECDADDRLLAAIRAGATGVLRRTATRTSSPRPCGPWPAAERCFPRAPSAG